jgi:hypothetical protein
MRLAFSFFPPREREAIAKVILARHGETRVAPHQMLKLRVEPHDVAAGLAMDAAAARLAARFGLEDALDGASGEGT